MPVATSLRSPWADQAIGARLPLAQYPRPMLVRAQWMCLNGAWDFAVVASSSKQLAGEQLPSDYQGRITVPFAIETVASGVTRALGAEETLFYRRRVDLPEQWSGRRVMLNFEAVDYETVVWINGGMVGSHRGGYLPFAVEVPAGQEPIEVVVGVRDPGPSGGQQYGKQSDDPDQIWYTATSGIWQSVWAEPLPGNAITQVTPIARATLDGFDITVDTERPTRVRVVVELPDGTELGVEGASGTPIPVELADPRPWSPDDPHRYRLTVTADEDEVTSWAGLRTVRIGPIPGAGRRQRPAVLLNNRPVLLNLPLDQGYWPESGLTAPADEALVFDLERLKQLGFNGVRKHIKVESRRFYDHADRLGMLVMQDAVNGGRPRLTINQSRVAMVLDFQTRDTSRRALRAVGRSDKKNRRRFEADLLGMISLLKPHPSVICWVIFNEAWGQYHTRRLERLVRGSDPTRLVDAASGWYDQGGGDFRSRHRYVLKLLRPRRWDRRPYLISEFGGYNMAAVGHQWEGAGKFGYRFYEDRAQLNEALAKLYRDELIPLVDHGLRGCVYTQLSDVETENNGLFSYDRQVLKPDAQLLRALNDELHQAFRRLTR